MARLPKSSNKELNKIIKIADKQGWTFPPKTNRASHQKCLAPDGIGRVTISLTPKSNATKKVISDFKRNGLKI